VRDTDRADLQAHYVLGAERDRLAGGVGRLEFIRTTEIVLRRLPAAPALVADIGGGRGRPGRGAHGGRRRPRAGPG
jgi:hypothetical protein